MSDVGLTVAVEKVAVNICDKNIICIRSENNKNSGLPKIFLSRQDTLDLATALQIWIKGNTDCQGKVQK